MHLMCECRYIILVILLHNYCHYDAYYHIFLVFSKIANSQNALSKSNFMQTMKLTFFRINYVF